MKTTLERLGDDTLRLDIEVPADMVTFAVNDTLSELSRDLRLPGFRPGKVPPQMALQKLGRDTVMGEVLNHYVPHWYVSALTSSGIRPIADPDFDISTVPAPSAPFAFSATVKVAPKPKLPDLSTLEVDKPEPGDVDKYVDHALEAVLAGAGRTEPTGAPAALGDEVVVDFSCTVDGNPVRGASATGYQAQLGAGRLLDELERAILGKNAEETFDVAVSFDGDHPIAELAGQDAVFHVVLREVMKVTLPELDDTVAAKVSEFDTAAALRGDIEATMRKRLEKELAGVFRGNAVSRLSEAAEINVPQTLIDQRSQELFTGMRQQLEQSGTTIEAFMSASGKSQDEMFADLNQQADDDVRRELCLQALAEDAGVVVTDDDLRAEIAEYASEIGGDLAAFEAQVFNSPRLDMLRQELKLSRAIDYLVENVKAVPVAAPSPDEQSPGEEKDPS